MNYTTYLFSLGLQDLSKDFDEIFSDLEEVRFMAKNRKYSLHCMSEDEIFEENQ